MKRRLIAGFFTLGFALAMADATASAGSVLVSNPSWQFVGPQSINGVLVRFGTAASSLWFLRLAASLRSQSIQRRRPPAAL